MNPLARFSFPKLPAAPKGGTIPLKGANRTMDKILNLLSLTPGEKEAFLAGLKLLQHGDKYLDGRLLAQRMGIELPPAAVPYNVSAKVDAKYAALVKDL